jgi:hypothetical protein
VAFERRRVVVTGLGLVSAIGNTVEESSSALVAGHGGAGPISRFDATDFPVRIACEVAELEVRDYADLKTAPGWIGAPIWCSRPRGKPRPTPSLTLRRSANARASRSVARSAASRRPAKTFPAG